ncbi:PREDICTED: UBN2_3 domain-containing [Prunus dulcis]|uniref:PREDICTED: UBN2_3 domain-containing n=1 Tax=Prunus dulcis TaxID=3755 RepID=A0A5E4GBV4_PRUDU|nr:PREDICTED: UBN2_3 domain-containing [Prunus dulcis]
MMLLHVLGQGKRGYLIRKVAEEEKDAPGIDLRCIEDSVVKGWLIKTMETYFVELFWDLPTAKDVWESAAHMYYDASDES